jgi:hypothetical protein
MDKEKGIPTETVDETLMNYYNDTLITRQEWRYRINSTLLLVCITMFAVVISLHVPLSGSCYKINFLRVAISSNSLCIILSGLMLYSHIYAGNVTVHMLSKHLRSYGQEMKRVGGSIYAKEEIKIPNIFLIFQKVSYFVFLLMIIFYTAFAIIK